MVEAPVLDGSQYPSCVGSRLIFVDRFPNDIQPDRQSEIRIELLYDPAKLPGLRDVWNSLLSDAVNPMVYVSWEWISRWWQHFGDQVDLWIVLAYDGDWLVGLLPLMVQQRKKEGISWKILTMIAAEFKADHLDMLIRRGYETIVPEKIIRSVMEDHPTVDLFSLSSLPEDSLCAQALGKMGNGWKVEVGETCPYICLEQSWEDYAEKGLNRCMGRKLRGAMNQVSSDSGGTIRFWQVKNERERARALDALIEMHREKWAGRIEEDPFASPESQAFHHGMSARLLKCGCLRMYVLSIGSAIVAWNTISAAGEGSSRSKRLSHWRGKGMNLDIC